MIPPKKLITEESLRLCMPTKYNDLPIYIFDTLDSTNVQAKELALTDAPHGTVVIARQQTSGRGRLGRSFFSPQSGIYLSVILHVNDVAADERTSGGAIFKRCDFDNAESRSRRLMLVTSAAAVAVAESIEEICGKPAGIKWVNDIYVNGKKVCGILTEGVTDFKTGKIQSLIVGIGINTSVTNFPPELLDIAGALEGDYPKAALTASVISKLMDFAEELAGHAATQETSDKSSAATSISPAPRFIDTYRKRSLVIGKTVTVYKGAYRTDLQRELPGRPARVMGIDDSCGLCIIYTDGTRETLNSGEISIRL